MPGNDIKNLDAFVTNMIIAGSHHSSIKMNLAMAHDPSTYEVTEKPRFKCSRGKGCQ